MGNSIYTIFMPREAFSRKVNAELVSRALLELDVPAYVNERHDIAVDGFKVSGSAYKIINKRAYHHGTMLIDADTAMLKGCLSKRNKNSNIVSKGVESVPSPVTNLRNYSYTIDHQQFCESVLNEFVRDYNDGQDIQPVVFDESHVLPQRAREMSEELQTWDWIYGQTPEFTNKIEQEFDWGHVNGLIRSRHGVITEADFTSPDASGAHEVIIMSAISNALRGCQYSEKATETALKKIKTNIPGLLNPENETIVQQLTQWINARLI
ncbi:hypothetical protein BDB00DRAFT_770336 [Zychaea mexicana]|uniref:uncharacterized protein n=1 Tax=Zychaea mexicana TaxID=64656 RepID=UPI0022FE1D1D|nr:uncharacterized protein BDB00DRAFT_770336 [Zychaea mexicana]KAI9489572.1 hypothetical protein BDB00DRAFT_770336 [Zychaea mexicana]